MVKRHVVGRTCDIFAQSFNFPKPEAAQDGLRLSETVGDRKTSLIRAKGLVCVNARSPSLLSDLLSAVTEGRTLLVEDVGANIDPVMNPVLYHRTFMKVRAEAFSLPGTARLALTVPAKGIFV